MSGAFGFSQVKTWETFEVKNIILFNYKFQIKDDFEINDDMPNLLIPSQFNSMICQFKTCLLLVTCFVFRSLFCPFSQVTN